MPEHQSDLPLDGAFDLEPAAPPEMREEIARAWNLPIGQRVEVFFRDNQLDTIAGVLELAAAPDFPWDIRQTLRLRIGECDFTTREIEHWKLL